MEPSHLIRDFAGLSKKGGAVGRAVFLSGILQGFLREEEQWGAQSSYKGSCRAF